MSICLKTAIWLFLVKTDWQPAVNRWRLERKQMLKKLQLNRKFCFLSSNFALPSKWRPRHEACLPCATVLGWFFIYLNQLKSSMQENLYKVSSSEIRLQSSIIQIIKKKPTTIARGAPPTNADCTSWKNCMNVHVCLFLKSSSTPSSLKRPAMNVVL